MKIEELIQPLMEWANGNDGKRAIIVIAQEQVEENGEPKGRLSYAVNGKRGNLIQALKGAIPLQDKQLAELIAEALKHLQIEEHLMEIANLLNNKDDE